MRISRLAPAVVTLGVLAGCGAPPPAPVQPTRSVEASDEPTAPPQDAVAARQLWRSSEPERYRYTIRYDCFCATYGRWRVDVEDGVVVRTRPLDEQDRGSGPNEFVRPIDELLADAARAESGQAGSIEATYDPETGVPTDVSIDWVINAVDDEIAWQITNFSPR